jgi:hypothetical protein
MKNPGRGMLSGGEGLLIGFIAGVVVTTVGFECLLLWLSGAHLAWLG